MVVIVVVLFLQTWRASIIPLAAVPISIVGTFAVMLASGFSINTLSLFGHGAGDRHRRRRRDRRRRERRATHRGRALAARREPSRDGGSERADHRDRARAVRGVRAGRVHQRPDGAVLPAVRAHDRVLDADLGVQLADAVAGARRGAAQAARRAGRSRRRACINRLLGWLFGPFNRAFAPRVRHATATSCARDAPRRRSRSRSTPASSCSAFIGFTRVPTGFVPSQDKQYLVAIAQLPDAASLDRTEAVIRRMSDIALKQPGVEHAVAVPRALDQRLRATSRTRASIFLGLKPFEERTKSEPERGAIVTALNQKFCVDSGCVRRRLSAAGRERAWGRSADSR